MMNGTVRKTIDQEYDETSKKYREMIERELYSRFKDCMYKCPSYYINVQIKSRTDEIATIRIEYLGEYINIGEYEDATNYIFNMIKTLKIPYCLSTSFGCDHDLSEGISSSIAYGTRYETVVRHYVDVLLMVGPSIEESSMKIRPPNWWIETYGTDEWFERY